MAGGHNLWMAIVLAAGLGSFAVAQTQAPAGQPQPAPSDTPDAKTPVLVELFTSEGCSSCPPADRVLAELEEKQPVEGREVIALGQHVDYWDYLGWKDPYSSPAWTDRQRAYARQLHLSSLYTPQMVVNGRTEFVGSDRSAARQAVAEAGALPLIQTTVRRAGSGELAVSLTCTKSVSDDRVFVAVTESGLTTEVKRGENAGRKLPHTAVVRTMVEAQKAAGGQDGTAWSTVVPLDAKWDVSRLKVVAFAAGGAGKPVSALSRAVAVPTK